MSEEAYNTVIFFPDETYEYVRRNVSAKEAVETAHSYCTRPAAMIGIIARIIVTDEGDYTNFDWRWRPGLKTVADGIVYPPR